MTKEVPKDWLKLFPESKRGIEMSGETGEREGIMGSSRSIAFAKVYRWKNKVIRLIRAIIKIKNLAQSNSHQS